MTYIVHLCPRKLWVIAQAAGEYRAPSLEADGFIHCSRPGQILAVANRFYRGQTGLALLWIDPEKVRAEIRWEAADGEEFPHIYGPLNLDAVFDTRDFPPEADGSFV
jgi:uncharacterized protein (DUF952 family)